MAARSDSTKKLTRSNAVWAGVLLLNSAWAIADPTLTIETTKAAGDVSPMMYGLMTEEINHSYDGGLYAELVQNRAFLDDAKKPAHWSTIGADGDVAIALDSLQPLSSALNTSLHVDVSKASADMPAGVANEGYWGIPVSPNTDYHASFYAKAKQGFTGKVVLSIQSLDGKTIFASAPSEALSGEWKQYKAVLHTAGDVTATTHARCALTVDQPGSLWLDLVSLFPPTWNDQPNGFRKDLMQMLVDMHPKFLRLPGGNYLEGDTIETRYEWKKTIGPLIDRPGHLSPWSYRSTDGLGLLEYLQWCEDMHAEPLLALFAGYALRGEHIDGGPELQPFVDDALEEIEYVNGDVSTPWGERRAKDGHPEPFPLHYVEIGNEDFFDKSHSYDGRFAQFFDAIRAKYPQLKIISSIGDDQPKTIVKSRVPDVLDEHYYRSAKEFISLSPNYYEKYSRKKRPEIFVGEWAAHEDPAIKPWDSAAKRQPVTPNFTAALGDACWMAAMERNSDLIRMNCYAPLLVNANPGAWQWRPDLIGYDALRAFGSPSYHAIRLFSTNVGDERLTMKMSDGPVQASATRESKSGKMFIKLVNPSDAVTSLHIKLDGVASIEPAAPLLTLTGDADATNSIDQPRSIVPVSSQLPTAAPAFDYSVPARSISLLTVSGR